MTAGGKLRVVLIYPPPWQVASTGEPQPMGMPFGAPVDEPEPDLSGDPEHITYGLLTIAAEARRAGHEVRIVNAFRMTWRQVVAEIEASRAEVFGVSAFTANRRGLGAVAALVRELHPSAHIVAGGPFVTALPEETLRFFPAVDTVVIGEGEITFLELLDRIAAGHDHRGIAGSAWREGTNIRFGTPRPRIDKLDELASPFDFFTSQIVMTSRGCPSKCTFCGSFTTWGKKLRFLSAEASVRLFATALGRLKIPFLFVKDDTFTADRRRAIAICDQIVARGMNFVWSCDSRVDSLDDELLRKMRLAGCQAISLGVESGSPDILRSIGKKTTPAMIAEATQAARRYGMYVRHYMMVANRGETPESVRQSIELVRACRPSSYLFSVLSIYPGTPEWDMLRGATGARNDLFFHHDFMELCVAAGRREAVDHVLLHIRCAIGTPYGFDYSVEEREDIVRRLPEAAMAHAELANAYCRVRRLDDADMALDRAADLGCPVPFVLDNQRACIAVARGDTATAERLLEQATERYPGELLSQNLAELRRWQASPAARRAPTPALADSILVPSFVNAAAPLSR